MRISALWQGIGIPPDTHFSFPDNMSGTMLHCQMKCSRFIGKGGL